MTGDSLAFGGRSLPDSAAERETALLKIRLWPFTAAVLTLVAGVGHAEPAHTAATFTEQLSQATSALSVDESATLTGAGAKVIADAVAQARYVAVGEDHLSREIPRFAQALCRLMAPSGLRALAVEIGPEAARVVNRDLRSPERIGKMSAFMRAHPDALAFQNARDESDMAAACARTAGPHFEIWGLDQEFFGSAGHLLEEMKAARPGPSARVELDRLAALDRAATAAAVASGAPGDLFVYTVTNTQMDAARTAFARDGGVRAKQLFAALDETRAIYLASASGEGDPNGRRARLMKRTLAADLHAAGAADRILFKFGDNHMYKGVNPLRQRDLGNFVAERAEGEGASSLHIAVLGRKGVHALYDGVGRAARLQPFVITNDVDYAWLKDVPAAPVGGWTVVDLRKLRPGLAKVGPQWREIVLGYDLLVLAPELSPSSLLGTVR